MIAPTPPAGLKTQADHARAYRKRKAAKLQRLAAYESALREIVDLPLELDIGYAISVAAVALAADRFELENGA